LGTVRVSLAGTVRIVQIGSSHGVLYRSAFEVRGVGSIGSRRDEVPPPSVPSPPGVSHALRGLVLYVRATFFGPLTLFGFITLQSFDPSGSCPDSSPGTALLDVLPPAPSYREP
jgi:hypothetical protein